jgi:CBS domain containing-hemolysin-like protein
MSDPSSLYWAIIFLVLALGGVVLRKTYFYLPLHELKRQALKHDKVAERLYRAAAFDNSLRGLLWLYIGVTGAASLVLLARVLPIWVSLLIVGPLLWAVFSLIPASRLTTLGTSLTMVVTPFIAWLLNYLHPLLNRGADLLGRRYVRGAHTRLFEREDLLELIRQQQEQPDNRVADEELEIARRALSFDDYKVSDLLTPRKQVKSIQADDTIGPILIDEVHKSDGSVLVRDSKKGPVIGSLQASQLSLDSKGKVRDNMDDTVYYLHENDRLSEALHAFFVTNHPLFVVVDSFEEYVGIITIENVIKHLLGHKPGSDFDQYSNLEAVAKRHTKQSAEETELEPIDVPEPEPEPIDAVKDPPNEDQ